MSKYKGEYERLLMPFTDALRSKMMDAVKHHGDKWLERSPEELAEWCKKECDELAEALAGGNCSEAMQEAVDVAVLAMFVWHRLLHRLVKSTQEPTDG